MSTRQSRAADEAWARVERDKQLDRFIKRVSMVAWSATFLIVLAFALLTGMQLVEMVRAVRQEGLPVDRGRRFGHPIDCRARVPERAHRHAEHDRGLSSPPHLEPDRNPAEAGCPRGDARVGARLRALERVICSRPFNQAANARERAAGCKLEG